MIINQAKIRRTKKVRSKLARHKGIPRLTVFRSNRHIWAQIIDDKHGRTLVSASSKSVKSDDGKLKQAALVGRHIAKKALKANIRQVRFDRGPYLYHGRIKSLADAARKEGLLF